MQKTEKIYIAGHTGLVGSAVKRLLEKDGYTNLVYRTHKELELTNQQSVSDFFDKEKPDYVFLTAAKVGGIHANSMYPADFMLENLNIQTNIIQSSFKNKVKKLMYFGSVCIYPKYAEEPVKEESLLTSALEPTNEPFAVSKIAGIKMCQAYRKQHGCDYISLMSSNLYGINDNFHPENSHVLPALMRRIHEAKIKNQSEVICWGDGSARREFMNSNDIADAAVFLMNNYSSDQIINIGTGIDYTIKECVEMIRNIVGYDGKIVWDTTKPNGTPKRLLDTTKINKLGWKPKVQLKDGLQEMYEWFKYNY